MTGKFKVGDRVKASGKWSGTYIIDRVEKDGYLLRGIGPANGFYLEDEDLVLANSSSTNPVVANALAATVARNAFYKTEEEAEYRAKTFIDAAINRIKGDFDNEINTVSDCIKLFKGAPMSDKAKTDLERLKSHLATLKKCKAMF